MATRRIAKQYYTRNVNPAVFTLERSIKSGGIVIHPTTYSATMDSQGYLFVDLPVPDYGAVNYSVKLPNGSVRRFSLRSGPTTDLDTLLGNKLVEDTDDEVVQDISAAVSSVSVSGSGTGSGVEGSINPSDSTYATGGTFGAGSKSADTTALNNALAAAASTGKAIVIGVKDITIGQLNQLVSPSNPIKILFLQPCTIHTAPGNNNVSGGIFSIHGSIAGSAVSFSSNVAEGSREIPLASVTGITKGTLLRTQTEQVIWSVGSGGQGSKRGQMIKVHAIEGSNVVSQDPIYWPHTTANSAKVRKVTPAPGVTFISPMGVTTFINDEQGATGMPAIDLNLVEGVFVEGLEFQGYDNASLRIANSYDITVNFKAYNLTDTPAGSPDPYNGGAPAPARSGYGATLVGACARFNCIVNAQYVRHAITTGGISKIAGVDDNYGEPVGGTFRVFARGTTNAGADTHEQGSHIRMIVDVDGDWRCGVQIRSRKTSVEGRISNCPNGVILTGAATEAVLSPGLIIENCNTRYWDSIAQDWIATGGGYGVKLDHGYDGFTAKGVIFRGLDRCAFRFGDSGITTVNATISDCIGYELGRENVSGERSFIKLAQLATKVDVTNNKMDNGVTGLANAFINGPASGVTGLVSGNTIPTGMPLISGPTTMTRGMNVEGGVLIGSDGNAILLKSNLIPQSLFFQALGASQTWTDMPATLTEYRSGSTARIRADLTNATQARLLIKVATIGATGSSFAVQYSSDETTWNYLDGASGPSALINGTSTLRDSGWVNLAAGAKADVVLRVVGVGGDGVADPVIGTIELMVR